MAYLYSYKVPVGQFRARVEADKLETIRATNYSNDEQRCDADGRPLWIVDGLVPDHDGRAQPGTVFMTHALKNPAPVAERKFVRLKNAYHEIRAGKPYKTKKGELRSGGVVIDVFCEGLLEDGEGK